MVSKEIVHRSFKRCNLFTVLDGSEDGELNEQTASANGAAATALEPEHREGMREEALCILFDSDSDVSFDGFDKDE